MFNQKVFCRPNNPNPTNSRNKWILCRSTSMLPGKYYWFNIQTGEAAWNDACENGKPQPKEIQMPSQPYKYIYQEPSSPPFDTSPNPSNNNTFTFPPNYQINNYPQPKQMINQSFNQSIPNHRLTPPGLGQVSFPKYYPQPQIVNEKATQPLFVQTLFNQPFISKDVTFSEMIRKTNELKRKRDQTTQTFGDIGFSVHTTSRPLHLRFLNKTKYNSELYDCTYQHLTENFAVPIKRSRTTFDSDNNYENGNLNKIDMKKYNQNFTQIKNKPKLTSKDIWTTTKLNNEINKISQNTFDRNTLNILNKVDKETNTDSKVERSMFSPIHEDQKQEVTQTKEIEPSNHLDKDDLRLLLLGRKSGLERSKKEDGMVKDINSNQSKATSNHKPLELVKKRVKFCDDDELITYDDEHPVNDGNGGFGYYEDREPSHEVFTDNFEEVSYIKINIGRLKNLSTCPVKDVWYIAVDVPSLVADYEFLIKLVNSDTACTLLIPEEVKRTLDAQCKGSCLGRSEVMLVRHVSRDLARRRDKICVQETLEKKKKDLSKNILQCCTEKTNRGYYVILITTDAELRRRCKAYDIPTFTIENIKEFVTEYDQNKPRTKPKTVDFSNRIQNSNAPILNSKTNGNIFLDKIYPQSFLESFESRSLNNNISSEAETQKNKDFSFKKTFSIEKSTFLAKNKDGKIFKIPKISKQTEKRFDLEIEIEEKLKKFTPSSNEVEQRFEVARESWLCSFGQIVEDGLTYILRLNELVHLEDYPPPWTFLEAIKCVKLTITKEANVLTKLVVDKLLDIVYDFTVKDFINPNIRYDDFLTIFGLTYLLFEAFKEKPKYSNISTETLANLDEMLVSLNDVTSQPDTIFDSKIPTVSIDICTDLVRDEGNKVIKKDEEVLAYLRRHYSQFNNDNIDLGNDNDIDSKQVPNLRNIKIIRTFGRDLDKITLSKNNNTKSIVMQKSIENLDENENDYHKNDIDIDTQNKTDESKTKIVRNISLIQDFEERLKKKNLYHNQNDTEIITNETDDYADYKKENFIKSNEQECENENIGNENDTGENDIDIDKLSNVMTSDSGIVKSNESLYAQTVVEIFLSEINSFFYAIFNFINKSTNIITKGELILKKKQRLIMKINIANEGIQKLVKKIQSIIEREAAGTENSFRILLVKSGVDPNNVKTYRYRQVLTKCLEQIKILSNALRILDGVARNGEVSTAEIQNINHNIEQKMLREMLQLQRKVTPLAL